MRKIKHLFLQLETSFSIVLLLSTVGCTKLNKIIKVRIVQDSIDYKTMVVFSYYIDSKGTEIKHGEYYEFHYLDDGSPDEIRRVEFKDGAKIYEEVTGFEYAYHGEEGAEKKIRVTSELITNETSGE